MYRIDVSFHAFIGSYKIVKKSSGSSVSRNITPVIERQWWDYVGLWADDMREM